MTFEKQTLIKKVGAIAAPVKEGEGVKFVNRKLSLILCLLFGKARERKRRKKERKTYLQRERIIVKETEEIGD